MSLIGAYNEKYSFEDLLSKLKIINDQNAKTIAFTDLYDHKFDIFEPADNSEISRLRSSFRFPIPDDYIHFLALTNGLYIRDYEERIPCLFNAGMSGMHRQIRMIYSIRANLSRLALMVSES